ncbi:LacI family DNA-binding transcriptional regulator [Nocardia amamiensis]|uniref:LacI family DNA-binding transcriptional regulator n=1 Tax=Nocardia TaxID=1817 RepID=UPI0034081C4A
MVSRQRRGAKIGKQRPRRVSAADVAGAAGVSCAAVSYVMNGKPGVSEATRKRVLELADELGFKPNALAASLRRGHSNVIGLVLADIANPFYPGLAAGVTDAAHASGYEVLLGHTKDDPDTLRRLVGVMIERQVDGVVLTALRRDDAEAIRELRRAHIPYVQLSRRIPQVAGDYVGIDDAAAARELMNHVAGHGYPTIAVVVGPRASSASAAREKVFAEVAREHGMRLPAAWRISTQLSEAGGRAAAEHLFGLPEQPAAVVCGSDAIALGVMAAALGSGLRIPDDLAVTGFDGLPLATSPLVDLTTVTQPRQQMARDSVTLLLRRIEAAPRKYTATICRHQLRIGRTCGCVRKEPYDG